MDEFDHAILRLLQQDNTRSHASIGAIVNLSASAVRRRINVLQDTDVIIGHVALTDVTKLGLTFIVSVSFEREDPEVYEAFRELMRGDAAVSQCYSVSGDYDFVLLVHATTPAAYEAWGERVLMAHPMIGRYSTSIVWSRTKFTTLVTPVDEADT